MLKVLFVVGQCLRLFHQDPWQSPTYRVLNVGAYSYQMEKALTHDFEGRSAEPITFDEQKLYEVVDCPKDSTTDLFQ